MIVPLFHILLYAEITDKQVDRYMEISRAKTLLSGAQYKIVKKYATFFTSSYLVVGRNLSNISKEKAKILGRKSVKSFVRTQEFVKEFRNTFKKIDSDVYKDIVAFYMTDTGKKLVKAGIPIKNLIITKESLEYVNRVRNTVVSYKKQKLLDTIAEEFNIIELKMKLKKELLMAFSKRDGSEYSREELAQDLVNIQKNFKAYNKILMHITYLDFNESELQEVLKYASSKAGKLDMKLMYEALLNYKLIIFKNLDYCMNEPIRNAIQKNNKKLKEIRSEAK